MFFFFFNHSSLLFLSYLVKKDMQTDVFSAKEELVKLGKDLDLTKKACSSVQQTAGEYCPDIQRQENTVKQLKNRYANIKNQLQYR